MLWFKLISYAVVYINFVLCGQNHCCLQISALLAGLGLGFVYGHVDFIFLSVKLKY